MGGLTRRALVIGVSRFGPEPEPGEEPELSARPALPYVPELAPRVAQALSVFGYESDLVLGGKATAARRLGRRVRGRKGLDPEGTRLVYVLSHGERPAGGTDGLVIIGSDGRWCQDTDVASWLTEVANNKRTHPTTLFLLDVWHGGTAARLPWQLLTADGSSRVWVIAACEQDRNAFGGRFTRALIEVLTDIAAGTVDINLTVEFVPLSTVPGSEHAVQVDHLVVGHDAPAGRDRRAGTRGSAAASAATPGCVGEGGEQRSCRVAEAQAVTVTDRELSRSHSMVQIYPASTGSATFDLLLTLGSPLGMPDVVFPRLDPSTAPTGWGQRPQGYGPGSTSPTPTRSSPPRSWNPRSTRSSANAWSRSSSCAGVPEARIYCSRSAPRYSTTPSPTTTDAGTPTSPTPPTGTSPKESPLGRTPSVWMSLVCGW